MNRSQDRLILEFHWDTFEQVLPNELHFRADSLFPQLGKFGWKED